MIRKLRWKFVFVTTALSMVILCLVLMFSFTTVKMSIEKENEDALRQIAEMRQIPSIGLPRFQEDSIRVPYIMVDVSRGGVVGNLKSNFFEMGEQLSEEELLAIVADALNEEDAMGILRERGLRFYKKDHPEGWRIVYLDMTMENNTVSSLQRNIFFIILGSCMGIFVLSLGLASWITKPVERAWNQQRQFVADASHELKTPLTVILSNTDMLLGSCGGEESNQRRLGNIRAESVRMKGLVEDMLYLARSDSGIVKEQLERVSVSEVLMDSVLLFEPLAYEQGKRLQYQLAAGLHALASENRLKQLAGILLDNAMKYSGEEGSIWVELEKSGTKTLRLMVANTGETMTAEQCRRIFERFYRTDPARQNNGGYGLGLSIASSIVKELEGKIWCESKDGINRFYVQLPLIQMGLPQNNREK